MLWEHPFDPVLPQWLGRVDVPALVVWGENDGLTPVALAPAWAALLPQATVATFPEAGHLVLDESADAQRRSSRPSAGRELTCRLPTSTSSRGTPVPRCSR